jgi:hypothetical protein
MRQKVRVRLGQVRLRLMLGWATTSTPGFETEDSHYG